MELITEEAVQKIIADLEIELGKPTSPEDLVVIVKKAIVIAINSIDIFELSEHVAEQIVRDLGVREFKLSV